MTRDRLSAGITLILLGVALYFVRALGGVGEAATLLTLGGLALAAYAFTKTYGLAVVGGLLSGWALGALARKPLDLDDATEVGLGAGFVLVYLAALAVERRSHWWPLVPGSILLLTGFGLWRRARTFLLGEGWPLILVIVGLLLVLGAIGRRGESGGSA